MKPTAFLSGTLFLRRALPSFVSSIPPPSSISSPFSLPLLIRSFTSKPPPSHPHSHSHSPSLPCNHMSPFAFSRIRRTATSVVDSVSDAEFEEELSHLRFNNSQWASNVDRQYPGFFESLSKQQTPQYLWIGCSDSRVPANEIVGLMPGEVFVHRNIANCVHHSDINVQSVIQYAVERLKVRHIIVCGHYGCGGVTFALENSTFGLADFWVRSIKDLAAAHEDEIRGLKTQEERVDRLVDLNVERQVYNVCASSTLQNAWGRGQEVTVHGFAYGLSDGIIHPVGKPMRSLTNVNSVYRTALIKMSDEKTIPPVRQTEEDEKPIKDKAKHSKPSK